MLIARIRDTPLSESKAFSVCWILTIRRVKILSYLMIRYRFSPEQTHDFIRSPSPMANSIRPAFQLYGRFCKSIKVNVIRHNSRVTSAVIENILEWVRWREPCFCLRRNTIKRTLTFCFVRERSRFPSSFLIKTIVRLCSHFCDVNIQTQTPTMFKVQSHEMFFFFRTGPRLRTKTNELISRVRGNQVITRWCRLENKE